MESVKILNFSSTIIALNYGEKGGNCLDGCEQCLFFSGLVKKILCLLPAMKTAFVHDADEGKWKKVEQGCSSSSRKCYI